MNATKSYWLKVAICSILLALAVANQLAGDWHSALPRPWNGLTRIGGALVEAISGLMLVYVLILLLKRQQH
jgi:hypothetical protein